MAKWYTVEITDWQGRNNVDFFAENHAEAVSLAREWVHLNGRIRRVDGPIKYRPFVKRY